MLLTRNGVLAWLGVLLVSSTMGQPQSDPLRQFHLHSKSSKVNLLLAAKKCWIVGLAVGLDPASADCGIQSLDRSGFLRNHESVNQ